MATIYKWNDDADVPDAQDFSLFKSLRELADEMATNGVTMNNDAYLEQDVSIVMQ